MLSRTHHNYSWHAGITVFLVLMSIAGLVMRRTEAVVSEPSTGGACEGFSLLSRNLLPLSGYNSPQLRAADVNNDGIADVVAVLPQDGKISVKLGDGEGGASSTTDFDAGPNPTDLEIEDVDRDGELDIVVSNKAAHTISILLGNGSGGFLLTSSFSTGVAPNVLEFGNFNEDSYLDLAVGTDGALRIYLGSRTLTFSETQVLPTLAGPLQLKKGDFNNDGRPDLFSANQEGNGKDVRVYLSQGNGSFSMTSVFTNISVNALAALDYDHDGFLDLVVNDYETSNLFAYKGMGDGNFQPPVSSLLGFVQGMEVIDYDRDDEWDLVTTSAIVRGDGSGHFTPYSWFGPAPFAPLGVAIADFNSDGRDDFARLSSVVNPTDSVEVILNNNGDRILANLALTAGVRPYDIDSADFNLDGRPDVVTVDFSNNRVYVFLQDGTGQMVPTPPNGLSMSGGFGVSPYGVTVGDLNGNSVPDIVVPDAFGRDVYVFWGSGDGTFVRSVIDIPINTTTPQLIRIGDFNGDARSDIVSMSHISRNFYVILNDGQGGFTVLDRVFMGGSTQGVRGTIGDFDADGKQDLVAYRSDGNVLFFYRGLGDGTFAPPSNIGTHSINDLQSADYDTDGHLDIAFSNGSSATPSLSIRYGAGDGTFGTAQPFPTIGSAWEFKWADYDRDGSRDFVVTAPLDNSITFLKGLGGRLYGTGTSHYVGNAPFDITSNDFNSDGKPDLAFATRIISSAYVVFNASNELPCLTIQDVEILEGNGGTVSTNLTVILSRPSDQTVSVAYRTLGRTTEPNVDFQPAAGKLVFPPGVIEQTVPITTLGDVLDEDNETIVVKLEDPVNALARDTVGVVKIIDDDAEPQLILNDVSINEGSGISNEALVSMTLTNASGRKIKARISTQDISAIAGEDYVPSTDNIFFNAGETTKSVSISTIPDYRVEPNESFSVNVSNLTNSTPPQGPAIVTLLNDDIGGNVQFNSVSYRIREDAAQVTIAITRANGNASDIVVGYSTGDGSAVAGQDYQSTVGMVTFGANEHEKTFIIPIINNGISEPDETFNITMTTVTGGAVLGTPTVAVITIEDDDRRPGFDFDGDRRTDYSVFRPSSGAWYLQRSTAGFQGLQFGADGDKLTPADYDGDGKTDIAIYRPSTGLWYILNSSNGTVSYPVFGVAEDLPAPGDYDGDGKADLTVFRPSQGTWYRQNSSNGSFFGFQFGATGDVPTVGDFDGDGKNDLGIFRPSIGDWYNLRSSNGSVFGERFGQTGDKIAPADYDGDGKTDIAIFRPSTGLWVVRNSATATYAYHVFGAPSDIPILGDYDGDGKADIGVWRPSDGTWYIQRSDNGQFIVFPWGQNGDRPTPSAYGN